MTRLEKIASFVPKQHLDVLNNTKEVVSMIDQLQKRHDELVVSQALAGIKPEGDKEALFRETLAIIRDNSIKILEDHVAEWNR